MLSMTNDQREIRCELHILEHPAAFGDVSRVCRCFGLGRASFERWRKCLLGGRGSRADQQQICPHNHPSKTPAAVVERVRHLRRMYPLGPIRTIWYLERYHGIARRRRKDDTTVTDADLRKYFKY